MFPGGEWTGVEIWEPYVEKYGLDKLYTHLHVANALDWTTTEHFDVAFAGDILEHLTLADAKTLLDRLKASADTVVVSIPIGHYPQDEYDGNPHERHVTDDWTEEKFIEVFGEPTASHIDGEIGVFIYSRHAIKPKIAVYAISKNEAHFVERFCASAKDADLILIADTGSTDGTVDVARHCGAVVHDIHVRPWRFDVARNAALALVPGDVDICVSLDIDEVLEPGWREEIERVWEPGKTTNLWYLFDWGCGIRFPYRKIHSRHGYRWKHPCHEDLAIDPRVTEVFARTNKLLVSHHPDPTKSRGQYMEILEAAVKEDDRDPTHFFYYARELTFYRRWSEAIAALHKYLGMNAASNQNERCYAMRLLGKSYAEKRDNAQAEKWYTMAAGEAPNTREPWCELAMLMYRQARWEECFAYSMRALRIKDKTLVYTCDPAVWGHWAHDLASIASWHLGLKDLALAQAELAAQASPDDPRLAANLRFMRNNQLECG
jgi:glycosyltransferase involved in cell wall biosynthesis